MRLPAMDPVHARMVGLAIHDGATTADMAAAYTALANASRTGGEWYGRDRAGRAWTYRADRDHAIARTYVCWAKRLRARL